MKMFTNSEQTAKLIKLGLIPKHIQEVSDTGKLLLECLGFSIGELLSFLPENIAKENEMPSTLNISLMNSEWCVEYADFLGADFSFRSIEVIDAIFDMLTKLKGKGVI